MERKKELIKVERGVGGKIAKIFNVSDMMVSKALSHQSNTKLAKKIRYVALTQYDGVVMVPKVT